MPPDLFRKSALDKLSSPEQLDQLMSITSPRAWIALAALGGLLAAVLLWSVYGSVYTKLNGQGIIVKKGGVFNVVAMGTGIVTDIQDLAGGDSVHKGQVIARIAQPVLEEEVRSAEKILADYRRERERIRKFGDDDLGLQRKSLEQQQATYRLVAKAREELIGSLERTLVQQADLRRDGLITQQRYEDVKQQLYAARQELEGAQNQLQQIAIQALGLENRNRERLRSIEERVLDAESRLEDARTRLELAGKVVSQYDGKVLEVMVSAGDMITENTPVASLEMAGKALEAVVYLPAHSEIKLVANGTAVQVSPGTVKREEYGFLLGRVASVSEFPATREGMTSLLKNEGLVEALSRRGPPIAVSVDLVPDPATASGYRWSSRAGARVQLSSGTSCTASVLVREQAPITLVIPLLKRFFGIY
jgi:HlyD family secretion protein